MPSTRSPTVDRREGNMMPSRTRVLAIALGLTFASLVGADSSRRMADGREWTTSNVNLKASASYCYDDAEQNCRRYGRLYTWQSAQRVCRSLGARWRLPSDDEWRPLAKSYGGTSDDSTDQGKAAFRALLNGGTSGFNAVLGGNRSGGKYERAGAHGFYWTASETGDGTAPF
jgi:uncharacterized protein (TIGR02145 family)